MALWHIGRIFGPGRSLLAVSILLPGVLFALASWQNFRDVNRDTEARTERAVRVLHEHATKVFETHRLVLGHVNERLALQSFSGTDQLALHQLLKRLQEELDQIATITITDAEGRMRASSRTYPADPTISFTDRDWFQALRASDPRHPYVSRSYTGRQSGQSVFNVADRVISPDGSFQGAIAISVDRSYFERFYASLESRLEHNVTLVRTDGALLAREPRADQPALDAGGPLMQALNSGQKSGLFEAVSRIDGVTRIFSYATVEPYPVVVGFGVNKNAALATWRNNLWSYGILAALSSLALLALTAFAIRQSNRERLASQRWQAAAIEARTEAAQRLQAEEQLRQSQKMEAVGRLTGGVAHDFNNLLTVVIGSLDLLRRRLKDDERSIRLVGNAIDGANRAATLTHRLLAFSRQQPLEPKSIDPNKLVAGMSEMLQRTLGETISIETVLAAGLWRTLADPNQLENAILNLAVNARDAMPGGGKLTIETANAHFDQGYAASHPDVKPGQYVMIAVSDTGEGMPPAVAAQAFEPFFTTKEIGKGTGLGLSQVYGFAKQSGGNAAIYSEPGHGTAIKIYLPRLRHEIEERPDDVVEMAAIERSADGRTILVIEDEQSVRQFSADALEEAGYRVLVAADGPSGLELLRTNPGIDLLFTDVVLAGAMNGRQVADEAQRLRPDLKVVFTTGYTRNAIIHHGRLDEGVDFIGKPFTAAALAAKIRAVFDEQRKPATAG